MSFDSKDSNSKKITKKICNEIWIFQELFSEQSRGKINRYFVLKLKYSYRLIPQNLTKLFVENSLIFSFPPKERLIYHNLGFSFKNIKFGTRCNPNLLGRRELRAGKNNYSQLWRQKRADY